MEQSTGALVEYNEIQAELAQLRHKHESVVYNCSVKEQDSEARKARASLVALRTTLEKCRVEIKAPVIEKGRIIDSVAAEIKAAIEALEKPIDAQIKIEESRKAAEVMANQARINGHLSRIRNIENYPHEPGLTIAKADAALEQLRNIDASEFEEFHGKAQDAILGAIHAIDNYRDQLVTEAQEKAAEAERARIEREAAQALLDAQAAAQAAEYAEFERLRAESAKAAEIERAKLAAERVESERLAQIEREKIAAERRELEAKAAQDRAEAAELQRAQQAKIDADREALRAEQVRADAEADRRATELAARNNSERMQAEKEAQPLAASPQITSAPPAPADAQTINIGQINALISCVTVSGAQLKELGFVGMRGGKNSAWIVYAASDVPLIVAAIIERLNALKVAV